MNFNFFETKKPKEFKLDQRYYDPVKEAEREKKYKEEGNTEKLDELRRIRLEQHWKSAKHSEDKKKLQKRLLIYAILAAALLAFVLLFPTK